MCLNTKSQKNVFKTWFPAETTVLVTTAVPDEVISESVKEVTAEAPSAVVTMELDTEVDETYCDHW